MAEVKVPDFLKRDSEIFSKIDDLLREYDNTSRIHFLKRRKIRRQINQLYEELEEEE